MARDRRQKSVDFVRPLYDHQSHTSDPASGKIQLNKTNRATSFLLVFVVVSLLTSAPVGAASFTWTGVRASENWDDASGGAVFITNWIPVSVVLMIPGSGDDVTFPDTGADFVVDLNGDRQVVSAAFTGTEGYTFNNNTLTLGATLGYSILRLKTP